MCSSAWLGCGGSHVECVAAGVETQALTNGARKASYLGLPADQERAMALLGIDDPQGSGEQVHCSGTMISADHLLTAAHCLTSSPPQDGIEITFLDGEGALLETTRSTSWDVHPTLDVAVVTLDSELSHTGAIVPLAVASSLPSAVGVGSLIQLGGFGLTETGTAGVRRFTVSELSALDTESLTVAASHLSGACQGDSGGPSLVRGDDGTPMMIGVLTGGTVTCFGSDVYVRTDAIADWLAEEVGDLPATAPEGGALGYAGRCFQQLAVWDEAGLLQTQACQSPEVCGWVPETEGYRCTLPAVDPCAGVDDLGQCDGDEAVVCQSGRLEREPCGECGVQCLRSPSSGRVGCLRVEQLQ